MYNFFAYMARMKYITRWSLMRNSVSENIQEHSHMVAVLAHALAVIRREVFVGIADPEACACAALFHDATEIFTGDLPTPIKYFDPEIRTAYHRVEDAAAEKLLDLLPEELRGAYEPLLREEDGGSYREEDIYYLDGAPLDTDRVEDYLTHLTALSLTDYATYTEDGTTLADYGLDAPAQTFTVTCTVDDEPQTIVLAFGKKGEDCYLRMDDSTIVYRVDADTYAEDIAAAGYDTLRPDEVLALNWDDVESIDFTVDDATYTAQKSGDTWKINGEEVEFDDVTAAIDGLSVNEFNTESPAKKQEAAFTVHLDNDDYPALTVALYQYDGENCLVQKNGETLGCVARSLVVDLTEAVNAITLGLE